MRAPEDYRLQSRDPSGCTPPDCDFYMGIDTNAQDPTFLDFYLVGDAAGWVAVGFTDSANMVRCAVFLRLSLLF